MDEVDRSAVDCRGRESGVDKKSRSRKVTRNIYLTLGVAVVLAVVLYFLHPTKGLWDILDGVGIAFGIAAAILGYLIYREQSDQAEKWEEDVACQFKELKEVSSEIKSLVEKASRDEADEAQAEEGDGPSVEGEEEEAPPVVYYDVLRTLDSGVEAKNLKHYRRGKSLNRRGNRGWCFEDEETGARYHVHVGRRRRAIRIVPRTELDEWLTTSGLSEDDIRLEYNTSLRGEGGEWVIETFDGGVWRHDGKEWRKIEKKGGVEKAEQSQMNTQR